MRRILGLLLLAGVALAQAAASFAGLVITSAGEEEFDISTGVTTLLAGGLIEASARGLTVEADFIRYKSGEFVEGSGASASGRFGSVQAEGIYLDVPKDEFSATGGISLDAGSFSVSAGSLVVHTATDVLVAAGGVTGDRPQFTADRLYHDGTSGIILLGGPYDYQEGILSLRASGTDALLELVPAEAEDGSVTFSVNSEPRPETLELFGAYF